MYLGFLRDMLLVFAFKMLCGVPALCSFYRAGNLPKGQNFLGLEATTMANVDLTFTSHSGHYDDAEGDGFYGLGEPLVLWGLDQVGGFKSRVAGRGAPLGVSLHGGRGRARRARAVGEGAATIRAAPRRRSPRALFLSCPARGSPTLASRRERAPLTGARAARARARASGRRARGALVDRHLRRARGRRARAVAREPPGCGAAASPTPAAAARPQRPRPRRAARPRRTRRRGSSAARTACSSSACRAARRLDRAARGACSRSCARSARSRPPRPRRVAAARRIRSRRRRARAAVVRTTSGREARVVRGRSAVVALSSASAASALRRAAHGARGDALLLGRTLGLDEAADADAAGRCGAAARPRAGGAGSRPRPRADGDDGDDAGGDTEPAAAVLAWRAPPPGELCWAHVPHAGWGGARRHRKALNIVFGALMIMTWVCVSASCTSPRSESGSESEFVRVRETGVSILRIPPPLPPLSPSSASRHTPRLR